MVARSPLFFQDEAAIIIQRQVRCMLGLKTARLLYGRVVTESRDASSGLVYYYNGMSGQSSWELPAFMNGVFCHASKYERGSRVSNVSLEMTASGSENETICVEVIEKKPSVARNLPRYCHGYPSNKAF